MPEDSESLSGQPEQAKIDVTESALKAAQKMQEVVSFTPAPIPKDVLLMAVLKKIPLLIGLLGDADSTTSAVGDLVKVTGKTASGMEKAASGLHFVGLALNIVNFLRIPCIYLAAYILGIKPPITLSNNAKWLYSGVLLAATIVSLTVAAAAPYIAIGAAVLALGVAAFTLGKVLYQRHQHIKAIRELTAEIEAEEKNLRDIQARALELESSLKKAVAEHDDQLASQLMNDITLLESKFGGQKQKLQILHDKRFVHQENLKKKDTANIADKAVAVILAAVAVIGLVVSLFFPPIGLGLLIGAGAAGVLYTVGRLMTPLFVKLGNWITGKSANKAASPDDSKDKVSPEPDLGSKLNLRQTSESVLDSGLDSTAITALILSGKQATTGVSGAQLQSSEVLNDGSFARLFASKPVMTKSQASGPLPLVEKEHEDKGETESESGKHQIR